MEISCIFPNSFYLQNRSLWFFNYYYYSRLIYVKILIVQMTIKYEHWSNKLSFWMVIKYSTWNARVHISLDIGTDFWILHTCLDILQWETRTCWSWGKGHYSVELNLLYVPFLCITNNRFFSPTVLIPLLWICTFLYERNHRQLALGWLRR